MISKSTLGGGTFRRAAQRGSIYVACVTALVSFAVQSHATEPMRIWVDGSGRFSIDARLVEVNEESIVLLRKSGGTVALNRDKISDRDQAYVDEVEESLESLPNALRLEAPKLPEIAALPILDLPPSDFEAEEGANLVLQRSAVVPRKELPSAVDPDASPIDIQYSTSRYTMGEIGAYDVVSRIVPIQSPSAAGLKPMTPSLALSISSGLRLPGQTAKGRIVRFDKDSNDQTIAWEGNQPIRMFDHHLPSGRSLVLIGHSPVGHGGQLAIATGWERLSKFGIEKLEISHRRSLPAADNLGRLRAVRWARWIDEEHVCVLLDRSIVVWNLVSGEQVFRVDGVMEKAYPALSAGRRYVAIPGTGTVDLYRTTDGQPIGRIPVEANGIPAVSFAPRGDALAIATTRRLRIWDLTSASLRADIQSRRSLGNDSPLWITDDLVMSGSGVLSSLFRGVPIWQYEMTGAETSPVGSNVAVLRKRPTNELSVVSVPHEGAMDAIKWIDSSPRRADADRWRIPGRSVWTDGQWADRDVRLSTLGVDYR